MMAARPERVVSAVYYLLAPQFGWVGLALAWSAFWLGFSLLDALLQGGSALGAVLQGVGAALLSGGLYHGIGNIWPEKDSIDPSLWRALAWWSAAFFPGFIVLFWRRL